MKPRERKEHPPRKRKRPGQQKRPKAKKPRLQKAAGLIGHKNVLSQMSANRSVSKCRSAFYFSEVREAHTEVIKYLPHILTDLVCEYSVNLNTCSIEIIKKIAHSSDQNDSLVIDAQARLGFACYFGENIKKDEAEGTRWLRLAGSRKDLASGQYALGELHFIDYHAGIDRSGDAAAIVCFREAAGRGYVPAQYHLGECYGHSRGVPKDMGKAVRLYRLASGQSYAPAQYNLAVCHKFGLGVPKNQQKAIRWYRLAARQGYAPAQCNLGIFYQSGKGVVKDYQEAIKWYRLAASQGHGYAKKNLKRLKVSIEEIDKETEKAQEKESDAPFMSA